MAGVGRIPFHEPGLRKLLDKHNTCQLPWFASLHKEATALGRVHLVCVATPQRKDSRATDTRSRISPSTPNRLSGNSVN